MFMTKTNKRSVREIAQEMGWDFNKFTAYCLLKGIKYDVAYEAWHDHKRKRRDVTKRAIASALNVEEKDIKWSE